MGPGSLETPMRSLGLVLAVLLGIGLAGSAAAPGTPMDHFQVVAGTLTPQESRASVLGFDGGPLVGGWVFLLVARVQGTAIEATLLIQNQSVASWTVPPSDTWVTTVRLPQDGLYDLLLRNPGVTDVTFAFYYDQSCNCAGKALPVEFPHGLMIFNVDTRGPTGLYAQFNEPAALKVRITAAVLANERALWPTDFHALAVSDAPVLEQVEGAPPVWLHEFHLSITEATRVYFFVEGVQFNGSAYSSPGDLLITPYFEETSPPAASAGLPPLLLGAIVGLFAVAGIAVLWRSRSIAPRAASRKGARTRNGRKSGKGATRRGGGRGGGRTRRSSGSRRRT